jgi:hypothetical protein
MPERKSLYPLSPLLAFLGEYRFTLLFGSLLLTIGGAEVLAELKMSWGINILILINLLVLLSVSQGRGYLWAGLVLFTLSLFSWFLSAVFDLKSLAPGRQGGAVALLIMGTFACFKTAFRSGAGVDRERIFASLSLYLMLGLIFALLFVLIDMFLPGSFNYPAILLANDPSNKPLTLLMYFSYVTLATLGYGDIVPLSGPARGLAILEAMIGQLYLVLVVARLVSLYGRSEGNS